LPQSQRRGFDPGKRKSEVDTMAMQLLVGTKLQNDSESDPALRSSIPQETCTQAGGINHCDGHDLNMFGDERTSNISIDGSSNSFRVVQENILSLCEHDILMDETSI
jgi:hypothetical protein